MSIATVQNAILDTFQKDSACETEFTTALTGTVSSSGTTVTGTGTLFTTELKKGDYIGIASKGYRKVTNIASDTSLTVSASFDTALSGEAIKKTEIKRGFPKNINLTEVGKTLRIAFATAAEGDREIPDVNVQVTYGFFVIVAFYEPDEDEAEARKSLYDKMIHDIADKNPSFGGASMGVTETGKMTFAEHPDTEGLYYGVCPLIVRAMETVGNR